MKNKEMKFYEFNGDYPYWAAVMAHSEEEAIEKYVEAVADLDEDDKKLSPSVISKDEALKYCANNDKDPDEFYTINQFENDCHGNEAVLIAIDASLY